MSISELLDDLQDAFFLKDVETVQKILFTNPKFSYHPRHITRPEVESLLLGATNFQCKRIIESLVNFLENGINGNLEMHLKIAIIRGNVEWAELLLKNGAKLDGPEWTEHSASRFIFCPTNLNARKKMLALLLKYDLDVSIKNDDGENLLFQLIIHSMEINDDDAVEIAENLMNLGVSVNEVNIHGVSPLMRAVTKRNLKLVSLLFNRGADIRIKDWQGETVVHCACYVYCEKIISFLFRKGADINVLNENDFTAFSILHTEHYLNNYDAAMKAMVGEFAKLTYKNCVVSSTDMESVRTNPVTREYFEKCTIELNQMSSTKFYGSHTFYSVLKMSKNIKNLAILTKNEEFLTNFEENITQFAHYEYDLRCILEEALQLKNDVLTVESRLYSVFGKVLPAIVIRILSENLTSKDLPLF